jgi:hypothetical protein
MWIGLMECDIWVCRTVLPTWKLHDDEGGFMFIIYQKPSLKWYLFILAILGNSPQVKVRNDLGHSHTTSHMPKSTMSSYTLSHEVTMTRHRWHVGNRNNGNPYLPIRHLGKNNHSRIALSVERISFSKLLCLFDVLRFGLRRKPPRTFLLNVNYRHRWFNWGLACCLSWKLTLQSQLSQNRLQMGSGMW